MTPYQIKKIAQDRFEDACVKLQRQCYFHRLFDTSDIRERAKNLQGVKSYAHLPKNPADYLVTISGRMFYAEVKGTGKDHFTFNHIEPSQMAGMIQQYHAGGEYYVFINQVIDNDWYCVPGGYFVENRALQQPIKSAILTNWRENFRGTNPLARFADA